MCGKQSTSQARLPAIVAVQCCFLGSRSSVGPEKFSTGGNAISPLVPLEPLRVGIEKQEDDQREGEDVGVKEKHDAAMVEAPATLEAADGFPRTPAGEHGGDDQQRRGAHVGEAAQDEGQDHAAENEHGSPNEGAGPYIEDGVLHGVQSRT